MYLWDKVGLVGPRRPPAHTICPDSRTLSSTLSLSRFPDLADRSHGFPPRWPVYYTLETVLTSDRFFTLWPQPPHRSSRRRVYVAGFTGWQKSSLENIMEMFKHELSGHIRKKKNQFEHIFMFSLITCREDWYDALYPGPYNNINISRGHFNQVLNEERHLWNKKVIIYER